MMGMLEKFGGDGGCEGSLGAYLSRKGEGGKKGCSF